MLLRLVVASSATGSKRHMRRQCFFTRFFTLETIFGVTPLALESSVRASRTGCKEAEGGEIDILVAWCAPAFSGPAEESGEHQSVNGDVGGRAENYLLLFQYRLAINPDPDDTILLPGIIEHDFLLYLDPAAHRKMSEAAAYGSTFKAHHIGVKFALPIFAPHQTL